MIKKSVGEKPFTEKICFLIQDSIKKEQAKDYPKKKELDMLYRKLYKVLLPYAISLSKLYKLGYITKAVGAIGFNRVMYDTFEGASHREMVCIEAILLLMAGIFGVKKDCERKEYTYIEKSFAGMLRFKFKEVMYDPKPFGSTDKYRVGSLDSIMDTQSSGSANEGAKSSKRFKFETKYLSDKQDVMSFGLSQELSEFILHKIKNDTTSDYLDYHQKQLFSLLKIKCIEKMVERDEEAIFSILEKYPRLKPQFFSSVFLMYNTIKGL